ncbi:protein D2-like [Phymastichus coffea]|uniref:protein D2-like n=1 Tax=Phymastichus coffea TaxID=108790 RepID=UPI00273B0757|nr:protein D2-like [Phymastichus coffea]
MNLVAAAAAVFLLGVAAANVALEFKAANIEPDIIDISPNETIEIKYGKKEIQLGTEITPSEAKDIPEIHYKYQGGILYTLVMTDPDIPVRGYNREWQHWVVGNIPEDKVAKGEVLTEYVGPAPPKNSGLHRYVFLLYRQNQGSITFDERRIGNRDKRRNRFSVKRFAKKYNLEGPIAGNYMKAQYDDYVPVVQRQIGIY